MTFPSKKEICGITDKNLESLVKLDSCGFPIAPGEDAESYKKRLLELAEKVNSFTKLAGNGKELTRAAGYPIGSGTPLPPDVIQEAAQINNRLYGFSANWVPAFFLSKGLSFLWGGCTVFSTAGVPLFFIRKSFRKQRRWFLYDREELMAHELCHAVHYAFPDSPFEEHFAYATSGSKLRRYMGNCFRTEWDAILFLIPVLLLLAVEFIVCMGLFQISLYPFILLAVLYPVFLLIRNQFARNVYFKAEKNLSAIHCLNPGAVLFRCTCAEIKIISSMTGNDLISEVRRLEESELRWKVILNRFFENGTL